MSEKRSRGSQTVDRALQVLDALVEFNVPPRLSDLSNAVGLNISTTSRLLRSLQDYGYVRRDELTGRFRLGYKIMHMGTVVYEQSSLEEIAVSVLNELVDRTNETATFNVPIDNDVMIVARSLCTNQLRSAQPVGTRRPLHTTATGKVLLAYLPDDRVEAYLGRPLERFTPNTIAKPDELREELQRIRERGYATSNGEIDQGLVGIAAVVRNMTDKVVASCGISGSDYRLPPEVLPQAAEHVKAAAIEISKLTGWTPKSHSSSASQH